MSGRFNSRGYLQSRDENRPKRIYSEKLANNSSVLPKTNLLSYQNDFPSLSGGTDKMPSDSHSVLKYSDTLKSKFQIQSSHRTVPTLKSSCQASDSNQEHKTVKSCSSEKPWSNSSQYTNLKSENVIKRPNVVQCQNSRNSSLIKENAKPQSLTFVNKDELPKQNYSAFIKSKTHKPSESNLRYHKNGNKGHQEILQTVNQSKSACYSEALSSNPNSVRYSKPAHESEINKTIKCDLMFDKVKLNNGGEKSDISGKPAKKKKRKSKVKRQTTLQSGKIGLLTPELHSKIMNQSSSPSSKNIKYILSDINNEEEYPELGKTPTQPLQKEIGLKKDIAADEDRVSDVPVVMQQSTNTEKSSAKEIMIKEKKVKSEKKPVRLKDPITIAFFDMLVTKNSKTKEKELKDEIIEKPTISGLSKVKSKKGLCHAPNLLDSSGPVVKRGKERETPKPKKPSHLKKIILLDRKLRRDHLLQMHDYDSHEENKSPENTPDIPNISTENFCGEFKDSEVSDVPVVPVTSQLKDMWDETSELTESSEKDFKSDKNRAAETYVDSATIENHTISERHLMDTLFKNLNVTTKCDNATEKERAAKILLHTRNFREYCNHLISKDIDDAVHALLDDLARFQDRMHQKDPVKARIKRRMVYGVKEVKKHIKLKKLKCIIIATDIENVESEGGLNDILNDIKSLAADHNTPCVFALGRKALGKVCHKPVPVSCIGVFNADGSEANFKKMLELLSQSKSDYADILNNMVSKLTDEETNTLIKAKKEAPETLNDIRCNILRQYFIFPNNDNPKTEVVNNEFTESSYSD